MTALVIVAAPERDILTRGLEHRGFIAHQADQSSQVTNLAAYDLLVLDSAALHQSARYLADTRTQSRMQATMLCAPPEYAFVRAALDHQIDAFLPLPWQPTELDSSIRQALTYARSRADTLANAENRGASQLRLEVPSMIQTESLGLISRLAVNLAHEINNPLTPIIGLSGLMVDDQSLTPENRALVQTIILSAQRIANIVQNLRGFTRPLGQRDPFDMRVLLTDSLRVLEQLMHDQRVSLQLDLPTEPATLMVAVAEIRQMLLLVLEQALERMPYGGRLEVSLKYHGTPGYDESIMIEIHDTAPPIPNYHRPHLFEPFYSASGPMVSSGPGLAVARFIAEHYGGLIGFLPAAEQGNTLFIQLSKV